MEWQKIPKAHHPLFEAAFPDDSRAESLKMFGGIAGRINGNMFGGLFADSVMVRLREEDCEAVLRDGGRKAPMGGFVLLPAEVLRDTPTLRDWLDRALAYTATLPPKQKKAAKKKAAKKKAK